MRIEKVKSYLGFAIRSGNVIFGSDKLFEVKKLPKVVIICSTQNEKVAGKVLRFCESNNIYAIRLEELVLSNLIARDNCKVLSILDTSLAEVIKKEFEMGK